MNPFVVVIPARHASSRLPGKPLRLLAGKPMLQHVWDRGRESAARSVIVATDDPRIADAARDFGAEVCMTSAAHQSGSERVAEVCSQRRWPDGQVVVNLQGDEPLMPAALIDQCAALLDDGAAEVATLASPLASDADLSNPNVVKVLVDAADHALYFSRAAIPHPRSPDGAALARAAALHHHGIYAYRVAALRRLVGTPGPAIERCEQLEQLRALYLGMTVRVARPAASPGPGVDTEEDLARVERLLRRGAPARGRS
ncbi:MAG: 3-deoxy-manno-octulosonate cytidylyltransferase [Woeseiaceae bacterium]